MPAHEDGLLVPPPPQVLTRGEELEEIAEHLRDLLDEGRLSRRAA
jgi:hypothetical protein